MTKCENCGKKINTEPLPDFTFYCGDCGEIAIEEARKEAEKINPPTSKD